MASAEHMRNLNTRNSCILRRGPFTYKQTKRQHFDYSSDDSGTEDIVFSSVEGEFLNITSHLPMPLIERSYVKSFFYQYIYLTVCRLMLLDTYLLYRIKEYGKLKFTALCLATLMLLFLASLYWHQIFASCILPLKPAFYWLIDAAFYGLHAFSLLLPLKETPIVTASLNESSSNFSINNTIPIALLNHTHIVDKYYDDTTIIEENTYQKPSFQQINKEDLGALVEKILEENADQIISRKTFRHEPVDFQQIEENLKPFIMKILEEKVEAIISRETIASWQETDFRQKYKERLKPLIDEILKENANELNDYHEARLKSANDMNADFKSSFLQSANEYLHPMVVKILHEEQNKKSISGNSQIELETLITTVLKKKVPKYIEDYQSMQGYDEKQSGVINPDILKELKVIADEHQKLLDNVTELEKFIQELRDDFSGPVNETWARRYKQYFGDDELKVDERLEKNEDFDKYMETYGKTNLINIIDSEVKKKVDMLHESLSKWLETTFVKYEDLSLEIKEVFEKSKQNYFLAIENDCKNMKLLVSNIVSQHIEEFKKNLSSGTSTVYFKAAEASMENISQMIKEAIMLYDADKNGKVDYALESGGGTIVSTRCSETFVHASGSLGIFGIYLWPAPNTPRTAIQPDVHPGRCWAFKGNQGFLVISLSFTIRPTGFTLDHIPVSISPTGSIDSAPKDFSVWGLKGENDMEGKLLGTYIYDINGEPMQYFPVQEPNDDAYSFVELKIHSNNGNSDYTCLYRFRVHGVKS